MVCYRSEQIAEWQEWLDAKRLQLAAVQEAKLALVGSKVSEFWLDTGEGKQRVTQIDVEKLMRMENALENDINNLYKKINCAGGLVNINLRRKGYRGGRI